MSGRYQPFAYSYTAGPRISAQRPLSTSPTEIVHITIAALVLTFDFVLLYGGLALYPLSAELTIIATCAVATLTGFVAHEMAHKISAERRGYWAEFRLSPIGLVISVITAALGFLFAAPGATMIGGMARPEDWGRTSLAGPATNFVFGILFLGAAFVTALSPSGGLLSFLLLFVGFINAWYATFNMIPIGPLDGAKVWRWSKSAWAASFVAFAVLAAIMAYLFYVVAAV